MKVFFDARYIRTTFHDGVSRYTTELGNALARITPVTFLICDEAQRQLLPKGADCILIHAPTSLKEPFTALILNKYKPDVLFSPMQTIGTLGRRFRVILALHDLIYYRHRTPPKPLSPLIRLGWRLYHVTYLPQRLTLNAADMVVTVSEVSKQDILSARLTKRPIEVIPNAPRDLSNLLKKAFDPSASPKNLIFMGSFMRYKNVEALVAAMEFLPDRVLHLLSPIPAARQAELEARIPSGAKVVFHNGVSDDAYARLLVDNAVLVSATRDEGFCLPLAEALKLGVPAVVSDLPVLHEVAGDGALYFKCNHPQDFANRILELDDPKVVRRLIKAGKTHIAQFSWDESAERLLAAIKML